MSFATPAEPALLPLLEREAPLERLREALADATTGEGRVVLVAGEAGVGKTALVRRLSEMHERDRSATRMRRTCLAGSGRCSP